MSLHDKEELVPPLNNGSSPLKSAFSGYVNPFKEGVAGTAEAIGSSIGGTVDNISDAGSIYGDMVGNSVENLFTGSSEAVEGLTKGFTESRGVPPVNDNETDDNDPATTSNERFSILDGSVINGNGDEVPQTKEQKSQNLGIFDKASNLFGDLMSANDLRRMTLYTIGGIMTGGSLGGSFKWAGTRVLTEQAANLKAGNDLNKTRADMFNKPPKQVKIEGINDPVQAHYIAGKWYSAATKRPLEGNIKDWDSGMDRDSQMSYYENLVDSVSTQIKNEDGKEITVGPVKSSIANSFMTQVQLWNSKGYKVDLTNSKTKDAYTEAVKRAFQANADHEEGGEVAVPSQFYEMTLIQGLSPGGDKNFQDLDGKYLSSDANADMVAAVDNIISKGLNKIKTSNKKGTVTIRSVMSAVKEGWTKLGDKGQAKYNEGAGKGYSGFSKYIMEQSENLKV